MVEAVQQMKERGFWFLLGALALYTFRSPSDISFATHTLRPCFTDSLSVRTSLQRSLLTPSGVLATGQAVEQAPVDLGSLRPTGTLPDGTELWEPPDDSPLAGTIRLRVRNGQVVGQEVLRRLGN